MESSSCGNCFLNSSLLFLRLHLPSDKCRTFAIFFIVASNRESACSISVPNSSSILKWDIRGPPSWEHYNLHSLFIELIGDVLRHVPDVAHAVWHEVHGLVLSAEHLLLLLQLHYVLPVGGVCGAGQAGVLVRSGAGVLGGGTGLRERLSLSCINWYFHG